MFAPRFGFAWRPIGEAHCHSRRLRRLLRFGGRPRDRRRRRCLSVRQPGQLHAIDRTADAAADDAMPSFRASPRRVWPHRPPTRSWRSASRRNRGIPTCSSGRSASSASCFHARRWSSTTSGPTDPTCLMRRNIAQARLYDPANPLLGRRPQTVPELRRLYRQRLERTVRLPRVQREARTSRGRGSILTFAYTWAKSTDSKSAAAGIGASGFNGWQGFLDNSNPERDHGLSDFDVDHRLVGSFVYNLPFGSGEKYRRRRDWREERRDWGVAGQRHLHVAAWVPVDDHGRRSRRAQRHVRHQPRRSRRRSEPRRANREPLVQHGGLRATGGRSARKSRPQHRARARA